MTADWEPGVQYNLGDSAFYNGSKYNIIQAHRSQSDWTPDATPALWGRVPGGGHQQQQQQQQQQQHQQQHQQHNNNNNNNNNNSSGGYSNNEKKNDSDNEGEGRTSLFGVGMSESTKKKVEIGGGIAAGAALLGAGFAVYKHHQKDANKADSDKED